MLVALAVIAAALLDPFQAGVAVIRLVGVVLVETGMHPLLSSRFARVLRIDGIREHRVAARECRRLRGFCRLGGSLDLRFCGFRRLGLFWSRSSRCRTSSRRSRSRGRRRGRVPSALSFAEGIPLELVTCSLGGFVFFAALLHRKRVGRRCAHAEGRDDGEASYHGSLLLLGNASMRFAASGINTPSPPRVETFSGCRPAVSLDLLSG